MYFNVYTDTGSLIEGYLIPDGFSARPWVTARREGETFGPFPCDIFLAGPYDHKHHETGVVGFKLDDEKIPGLGSSADLEISDTESGFVFYRRLLPHIHVMKRVFRLETQFAPHSEFDRSLKPSFQFFADHADRYGSETVRQMLEVAHQPSTYVSGRVMLKSVQRYLTQDTVRIVSLRDPFYELALRLWAVAAFRKRALPFVSERDEILFRPAMDYFYETDFSDFENVKKMIRTAPKEILGLFVSPFTHQLVAASPSDNVSREGVSSALDALSQFTVFDADEHDDQLARDTGGLLGLDESSIAFSPVRQPFLDLAEQLREVKILEQVLETDLILFHFIRKAAARAKGR